MNIFILNLKVQIFYLLLIINFIKILLKYLIIELIYIDIKKILIIEQYEKIKKGPNKTFKLIKNLNINNKKDKICNKEL